MISHAEGDRFPFMKAATSQTVDLMSKVESDGMLS
jgi:hypothetical protein